jgi:hypothetical protein
VTALPEHDFCGDPECPDNAQHRIDVLRILIRDRDEAIQDVLNTRRSESWQDESRRDIDIDFIDQVIGVLQ